MLGVPCVFCIYSPHFRHNFSVRLCGGCWQRQAAAAAAAVAPEAAAVAGAAAVGVAGP